MAQPYKDYFDARYARQLAEKLAAVVPDFPVADFVARTAPQLAALRFSERIDCLAAAFDATLPGSYPQRLAWLTRLLGPPLPGETGMFTLGGWLFPFGRFVEQHALEDFSASVAFIHALTQRHTGEFAVRPLLAAHPKEMLTVLLGWSGDESVHVRRLASEGARIRLPWAKKLTVALAHFSIYRLLLTRLKDDPSRFVQKSVGNNLNDLFREAPDLAWELVCAWQSEPLSEAARWVIRHGTRSLPQPVVNP